MKQWKKDFKWLEVRHFVKDSLGNSELPDLNGLLIVIGIQELGRIKKIFTKEEKQDLMHIGTCRLLEQDGFYQFIGRDEDGWPHYNEVKNFKIAGHKKQSEYLKDKIIEYFQPLISGNEEE